MKNRQALKIIRRLGFHRFLCERLSKHVVRLVAYNRRQLKGYRPETICKAWAKVPGVGGVTLRIRT